MTDNHPLTAEHYDQIMAAQRSLHDAANLSAKAQVTGMDTRAHDQAIEYLRNQLTQMQLQFFPKGRPT